KLVLGWYRKHGRHNLPWRSTHDPYRILVSEIMLQQTQVDRVCAKYKEFLAAFPTVGALAKAPPRKVLQVWKGLGYNRRALNLQRAAQSIVRDHGGKVPRTADALESLPGIGPYTARAVRVFAWNEREAVIETNIRRIYIHYFFADKDEISDKQLLPIIEKTMLRQNPREWYWALMDYGAGALKGVENPNRRSKHYVRQSKFEGSQRYARAKLLDFVLQGRASVTLIAIKTHMARDSHLADWRERATSILAMLVAEGFIERTKNGWRAKQ
ncbi:MAG: A/G-specific adenine glycosylase, partial [Candidatus Ryanbacteria bacterium]|nr:A/G-specific adenine glycosylase [Candidatus Ryanbacteria bacterium]